MKHWWKLIALALFLIMAMIAASCSSSNGGGDDDAELSAWQQALLGPEGSQNGQLELLAKLLPVQLRQFSNQLILLHELQRERVLLAWPAAMEIK